MKKFVLFVVALMVLLSAVGFACECSDNPSISYTGFQEGGDCCIQGTIQCPYCGNCTSSHSASGNCSIVSGGGHNDFYVTYKCCNSGNSVSATFCTGINGGCEHTTSASNTCCTPSCPTQCGQANGCGENCGSDWIGTNYANSCDITDRCGFVRNVAPYNDCDISGTVSSACGTESVSQCNGLDDDCDGRVDYNPSNGLECVKNDYNPTEAGIPANSYSGDCTSQCKVCKDNKVSSLTFSSGSSKNDVNVINLLNTDTEFEVKLNALSPNNCITGYNFELLYSKDNGVTWSRVDSRDTSNYAGAGENNFKSSIESATLSSALPEEKPSFSTTSAFTATLLEVKPKAFFAPNDICVSSSDCNILNFEVCNTNKCKVSNFSRSCSGNNMLLWDLNNQLATAPCNPLSGGCLDTNGIFKCNPLMNKVCDIDTTLARIYSLDQNGGVSFVNDCNRNKSERCINGSCCAPLTNQCIDSNTATQATDTCGNVTITNCSAGQPCVNGFCCAPIDANVCNSSLTSLIKKDTCGNETTVQNCQAVNSKGYCVSGLNKCCAPTSNLTCAKGSDINYLAYGILPGSNIVAMVDSCSRKVFTQDCGLNACTGGQCCQPDFNSTCSLDKTAMLISDSCGNITTTPCAVGKTCSAGYCLASYTAADGEGYKEVSTSSKTYKLNFNMRYLPVGYKYKVRAQAVDNKIGRNVSGATYADNSWFYSNILTVINTISTQPSIVSLDRDANSKNLITQVSPSDDPDVFPLPFVGALLPYPGSQTLSYFARIYEQLIPPTDPASTLTSKIRGTGFVLTDASKKYSKPLLIERDYCSEGRAFDGNDYSIVSPKKCTHETPYQPVCEELKMKADLIKAECNTSDGNSTISWRVACGRDPRMDEDWTIGVNGITVTTSSGNIVASSLVNPLVDCNSDSQVLYSVVNAANEGQTYSYTLDYGGTYNAIPLSCHDNNTFTLDNCGYIPLGDECSKPGLSALITGAKVTSAGTNLNLNIVCTSSSTAISLIDFYNSTTGTLVNSSAFLPA